MEWTMPVLILKVCWTVEWCVGLFFCILGILRKCILKEGAMDPISLKWLIIFIEQTPVIATSHLYTVPFYLLWRCIPTASASCPVSPNAGHCTLNKTLTLNVLSLFWKQRCEGASLTHTQVLVLLILSGYFIHKYRQIFFRGQLSFLNFIFV